MTVSLAIKDDFFERNLEVFRKEAPWLYRQLQAIEEPHSRLIDDGGEPDIEFQGTRLYGMGSGTYIERQIDEYWKRPFRMNLVPPQSATLDAVASRYTTRLLQRAVEEHEMVFSRIPTGRETFFMIVYGIGLGGHIEPLLEQTNCKGLILIEPNLEFIYHSLFTFDWTALFERFEDPETYLHISVGTDYKHLSHNIRNFVRGRCPSFFDGTLVYTHYKSSVMEMTQKQVEADANLFLSGLGFLDDEFNMIRNTFENLKDYDSLIYQLSTKSRALPAFVVGSGPSLDKSFEVLRANQDKAVIISCGTALGVLLANGIMPDFQIEIENVELVYDILKEKTETYDLSDVCLVSTTTADSRIRDLFKKRILYFRQVVASWDIFSLGFEYALHDVGPTVTNGGLSFAQQLGFTDIYLFGVDYGTRRREDHHAKDSEYRPGGKAAFNHKFTMERPANFGGTVFTHGIFIWARETVEQSIRRFRKGTTYYNCSDGMAIDGAVPRIPKVVSLPETDKAAELANLFGELPRYSREQFEASWFRKDWAQEVEDLCDRFAEHCDLEDADYPLRYMTRMCTVLVRSLPDGGTATEIAIVRGSLFMMMLAAGYYLRRVTDPEKKPAMEALIREEFRKTLDEIKHEAAGFLRGLEP